MSAIKPGFRWSTAQRNAYVAALAALALLSSTVFYPLVHAQRVHLGVQLAGISVGGTSRAQAEAALRSWYASYEARKLVLRDGAIEWEATPADLGITIDLEGSAEAAFAVGRKGNLLERWWTSLLAVTIGRRVEPVVAIDDAAALGYLQELAKGIDEPAREARLVVDDDGLMRVRAAQRGRRLNVEETLRRIIAAPAGTQAFDLAVETIRPQVADIDLQNRQAVWALVVGQPFVLRYGDAKRVFTPAELAPLLMEVSTGDRPVYRVDMRPFRMAVEALAQQINRPPVEATLSRQGGKISISDSRAGARVNVEASLDRAREQIASEQRTVDLDVEIAPPGLASSELEGMRQTVQNIVSEPLSVRFEIQTITITRESLAASLMLKEQQIDGRRTMRLSFDDAGLKEMASQMARTFDREPKNARFSLRNGRVFVMEEARDGVKVRQAETAGKLAAALLSGEHLFVPEVQLAPAERAPDVEWIVVDQRLMDASTSYYGSIPAKRYNIELAASRLDGTLIAPGEVFSFNKTLPTRLSDGFQMGYGISMQGDEAVTIPAEAGGICQVVTTLFHAVFWSGVKVKERWPHMYWINSYGQPPRGMKGLDATVDGSSVDFRFENNTGNWLAIRSWTEDSKVYFELWGKAPGWKVEAEGPKIEKVVPTDREIVYRDDPAMKPGQQLQVEAAMDGFDSTIYRRVSKDGKLIDELTVRSSYMPSRNVVLTYPRPATSTPEPEPSPTATRAVPTLVPTAPPRQLKPTSTPPAAGTPRPPLTPQPSPSPKPR